MLKPLAHQLKEVQCFAQQDGSANAVIHFQAYFFTIARRQAIPPQSRGTFTARTERFGHFQNVGRHGIRARLKHHGVVATGEEALQERLVHGVRAAKIKDRNAPF